MVDIHSTVALNNLYSAQWAFGVTCWEVYSGGRIPYSGVNPVDLPHMLQNGYRMEKPDNAACLPEAYVSLAMYLAVE